MAYHSKYLKDTGLISAYQSFISQIMKIGAPEGDIFLEASKFFTNYEKKHKQHLNMEIPSVENEIEKYQPKERKRIILESRTGVYPSAPIITPNIFERQPRTRPLIGSYKKEEINYKYNDILDGHLVNLGNEPNAIEPEVFEGRGDEENLEIDKYRDKDKDNIGTNNDFEEILDKELEKFEGGADI